MIRKEVSDRRIMLLRKVVFISALFALILTIMIVVNFIQLKRSDPLNSKSLMVLTERLKSNSDDQLLREEIRSLDLLARKAYFTSQWQVRAGGYLLLISLVIAISGIKLIELLQKALPEQPGARPFDFWDNRIINRRWIAYTGLAVVALTLLMAWLTQRELGTSLDELLMAGVVKADSSGVQTIGGSSNQNGQQPDVVAAADSARTPSSNSPDSAITSAGNQGGFPSQAEILRNFTTFRGPGAIGVVYQKNLPVSWDGKSGKNIRWKSEVPLPGFNSPIIWNDKVFVSGASETAREVYCFDGNTGKIVWRTPVEKVPGTPSKVPAVNIETGLAAPTMTTDGRRVYAVFANGDLAALDLDGRIVWAKNLGLPVNHYGHSSSLIMYHDLVIVQFDQHSSASVMAFDGMSGELKWKTSRSVKVSWASPIMVNTGGRSELILAAEPSLISYNPANGKELWKIDCISGEVGPSPAFANGIVFSVNEYSKLAAVQIGPTPKLLWEDSEYLSDVPSPVASNDLLFLATSYGTVVCYNTTTGEKYWEHEFDKATYSSPMLAEGKIYLLDKFGVMHIFKAGKEFSLIGAPALGEGSFCTPAFADGRIYIRGDKNLYCIGR